MFITGDIHGRVQDLAHRLMFREVPVPDGSNIVVLGDVGINYYLNKSEIKKKEYLSQLPYTFYFIHGNHEARPANVAGYIFHEGGPGRAGTYIDPQYPNQIFLQDGVHYLEDKKVLVAAGAYSVDKFYRLQTGNKWFEDEQMPYDVREWMLASTNGDHFDMVFAHTCPYLARPLEEGLSFIDQSTVDDSMEIFLQRLVQNITFDRYLCGHWHYDGVRYIKEGKIEFLYGEVVAG